MWTDIIPVFKQLPCMHWPPFTSSHGGTKWHKYTCHLQNVSNCFFLFCFVFVVFCFHFLFRTPCVTLFKSLLQFGKNYKLLRLNMHCTEWLPWNPILHIVAQPNNEYMPAACLRFAFEYHNWNMTLWYWILNRSTYEMQYFIFASR